MAAAVTIVHVCIHTVITSDGRGQSSAVVDTQKTRSLSSLEYHHLKDKMVLLSGEGSYESGTRSSGGGPGWLAGFVQTCTEKLVDRFCLENYDWLLLWSSCTTLSMK